MTKFHFYIILFLFENDQFLFCSIIYLGSELEAGKPEEFQPPHKQSEDFCFLRGNRGDLQKATNMSESKLGC